MRLIPGGVAEQAFLKNGGRNAVVNARDATEASGHSKLLETVCDYWGIGAWDEVAELCRQADAHSGEGKALRDGGARFC